MPPKTLFDKIWESHRVANLPDETTLLYIDRHLVHEVTSPQAFEGLRLSGRKVRRPELTVATMDHNVPTVDRFQIKDEIARAQIDALSKNCAEFGIRLYRVAIFVEFGFERFQIVVPASVGGIARQQRRDRPKRFAR